MKKKRFVYDYDKKLDKLKPNDIKLKYKWKWGKEWFERNNELWAGGAHGQVSYTEINKEWSLQVCRNGNINEEYYGGTIERYGDWFAVDGEDKKFKSRIEAQIYTENLFKIYIKSLSKVIK